MITRGTQTVLPAGWVHLGFSIIEMTLVLAFVFIRAPRKPFTTIATILALAFFLAAGVSGYFINHGLIPTDVVMVLGGTALVAIYPWARRRAWRRANNDICGPHVAEGLAE
jgi:general stress protein CsbA